MAGARPTSGRILDRPSRVSNYGVIAIDAKMGPATRSAVHDISRTCAAGTRGRGTRRPARPLLNETAGGAIEGPRTKHNGFLRGRPTASCTGERYHDHSKSGTGARQGFATPIVVDGYRPCYFSLGACQVADDFRRVPRRHPHGTLAPGSKCIESLLHNDDSLSLGQRFFSRRSSRRPRIEMSLIRNVFPLRDEPASDRSKSLGGITSLICAF